MIILTNEDNFRARFQFYTHDLYEHVNKIISITNNTFTYLKNKYGQTGIFIPTTEEAQIIIDIILTDEYIALH